MSSFHLLVVKICALLSFCGGPLLLFERLRPVLGKQGGFAVSFCPIALLLLGTLFLPDRPRDALARWFIRCGMLGALLLVGADLFAAQQLMEMEHQDRSLIWTGIVIGLISAGAYLHLARRPLRADTTRVANAGEANLWPGPSLRDWSLLAVSLLFVAAGAVLTSRDPRGGLPPTLFFGACAMVFVGTIRRKLRQRRSAGPGPAPPGGVPLRPSRVRMGLFGTGLLSLGAALLLLGEQQPWPFQAACAVMLGSGFVVCTGVVLGWLPVGYIRLDPAGLTLGRRGFQYSIPWDSVARIAVGEFHDNPVLLLDLHDHGAIEAETPEQRARALKELGKGQKRVGADVMLIASLYGLDLPSLSHHVGRYVTDPESRSELQPEGHRR